MDSVLIIDDDQPMLEILSEVLEARGYTTVVASSGTEGIERFRENPTDIVITDLIMPDKCGISVIEELKAEFPTVRIIVMSGTTKVERFTEAVDADANRIIAKPFDQEELLEAVAQLLDFDASPSV